MNNIDFIKKAVSFAENYEAIETRTGIDIGSMEDHAGFGFENNGNFYGYKALYRDFLQQVIEGINAEESSFVIIKLCDEVRAYDTKTRKNKSYSFQNYPVQDAKRAAIEYVLERIS